MQTTATIQPNTTYSKRAVILTDAEVAALEQACRTFNQKAGECYASAVAQTDPNMVKLAMLLGDSFKREEADITALLDRAGIKG